MRKMKDSGLEWVGQVPVHWKFCRLKYLVDCLDGRRVPIDSGKREPGPYPYWGAGRITDYVNDYLFNEELILLGEDGSPFFDDTRPVAFLVNDKIWVNNHIHVLRSHCDLSSSFLVHYLNSVDYHSYINGSILNKLTQSNMNEIVVVLPDTQEQRRIADFLNAKCAEIDALATDIQAEIDTLEQYRCSVITETVTKGLDPEAEMKDSGIEYPEKIPIFWQTSRFKYWATIKSNLVEPAGYEDCPQISPESIEKNSGKIVTYNTVEESGIISGNHLFFPGQILYSKIRPNLNKVAIAPFSGLCSADMYPIETRANTKFMLYLMLSDYFVSQVSVVIKDRVKMPKINQDELGQIKILVPPMKEQKGIAEYLDARCAEIDGVVNKKREQLSVIDAYKKSVIYEYVTGKKEVPSV